MEVTKIVNPEQLFSNFLTGDQTYVDHDVARLTAPGDNFGSLMLAVKIYVKDNDQDRTIDAVAKLPPPNEFVQKMFQTQLSFPNEIGFYKDIVPYLRQFQKEQGLEKPIECFPAHLASRWNAKPGLVDKDGVLLMESLKVSGFVVVDRTVGFDLDTTLLILKDLAEFHSIPIAVRHVKPAEFEKKIRPFLKPFQPHLEGGEFDQIDPSKKVIELLENEGSYAAVIPKLRQTLETGQSTMKLGQNVPEFAREPFATIIHRDLWVNNTMVKFENGKPVQNKFVDFQLYEYGSPARDVVFFLLSSVQLPILKTHLDYFIEYYYDALVKNLQLLQDDTKEFSLAKFEEELRIAMTIEPELSHTLMMLNPIYAPRGSVQELSNFSVDALKDMFKNIPENQKERTLYLVDLCIEKGWF